MTSQTRAFIETALNHDPSITPSQRLDILRRIDAPIEAIPCGSHFPEDRLLGFSEAAAFLGISRATFWRVLREDESRLHKLFPSVTLTSVGHRRWRESTLRNAMAVAERTGQRIAKGPHHVR